MCVLGIKPGQLLTTTNPAGLFVLNGKLLSLAPYQRVYHEHGLFSKRIPVGEVFLCLESAYIDTDFTYQLKILYKENIYFVICNINELRVIQ